MIIDHIKNIPLTDKQRARYFNELKSLDYLAKGLYFLYGVVKKKESDIIAKLNPKKRCFIFGNSLELNEARQDLVACFFHWYAVSVCNYVKLVGWLANSEDKDKAEEYLKSIIPKVKLWRNKIGGHFARHTPREKDNPVELDMSIMLPIGFNDDAFFSPPLNYFKRISGITYQCGEDMRWSLTKTHEELITRYWPNHSPSP